MANFLHQTYLRELRTMDERDAVRYVYVFKLHEEELFLLPIEELFPLLWRFANDLYEISDYKLCLYYTKLLVNIVIAERFTYDEQGNDLLVELLEQKARAHQALHQWSDAQYTSLEVLKIQPNKAHCQLYRQSLAGEKPRLLRYAYQTALILGLVAVFLSVFIFIMLTPHYPDYYQLADTCRWSIIGIAIGLMLSVMLLQSLRTYQQANREFKAALGRFRQKAH